MKKIVFFIIAFSIVNMLYSQSDYRAGYYITNTNDTIYGFINYGSDSQNNQVCKYKKDEKSEIVNFIPGEINSYRFVDGKYYVTKKIQDKNVFLECLIKGKATIYYYRLPGVYEKYYIEKEDKIYELENPTFFKTDNNGNRLTGNTNQFKGMLKYNFEDCPSIFSDIDNSTLSRNSLINISKKYHQLTCSDYDCIIYEKKKIKIKVDFGFFFKYGIHSDDFSYLEQEVNFNSLSSLAIGSFLQSNIPGLNERLIARISLQYSQYNYRSNDQLLMTTKGEMIYDTINWKTSQSVLSGNLSLKYLIPLKSNYKLVPHLGLVFDYNIKSNSEMSIKYYIFKSLNTVVKKTSRGEIEPRLNFGIDIQKKINDNYEIFVGLEMNYQNPLFKGNYFGGWISTGIQF